MTDVISGVSATSKYWWNGSWLLMDPPGFQQGARVRRRQRWAADGQLVAAANKKAEGAKTKKVESEEVETIGKKGAEVEPLKWKL